MKLWLKGAKQIVQVVKNGELYLTGDSMKSLAVLEAPDGEGLSVIVDDNGNILDFGPDSAMEAKYAKVVCGKIVDVSGNSIIPGENFKLLFSIERLERFYCSLFELEL